MTRREDRFTGSPADAAAFEAAFGPDDYDDDRPTLAEATADLGGRAECGVCGRFVFADIHHCGGVPVTYAARDRAT